MKIHKGSNRLVIVFPSIHIAIKLPIVYLLGAMKYTYKDVRRRDWNLIKILWNTDIDAPLGTKWLLFKGIKDNWKEFTFYLVTQNPFIQPTYFSLLGLVNIQRADDIYHHDDMDMFTQLCALTENMVGGDMHHFRNSHNFCVRDGKLRTHDYGSRKTRQIISKYGNTIVEKFVCPPNNQQNH